MHKTYHSMMEAEEELGRSQPTIRKHIRRLGITTYRGGADHRARLIHAADLDRLRQWFAGDKEAVTEKPW